MSGDDRKHTIPADEFWTDYLSLRFSDLCNDIIDLVLDLVITGKYLGNEVSPTIKASFPSQSTPYTVLSQLLNNINIDPEDVFLDVGCAQGRVISWWLHTGIKNKILGLEVNKALAAKTAYRLKKFSNVSISPVNIFENFPAQASVIYLYNPFEPFLIEDLKNLIHSNSPDNVRILYYNCPDINFFLKDSRFTIRLVSVNVKFPRIINDSLAIITKKQIVSSFVILSTGRMKDLPDRENKMFSLYEIH